MKKLLFYLMILSALIWAISACWLIQEIWIAIETKEFDFAVIPTFAITTGLYGLFYVLNNTKRKYKRRLYHYYKDFYIPEDSQTPIRIK